VKNDALADPVLSEFLQVMRPRNKKDRSWANDDAVLIPPVLPSESKPGSLEVSSNPPKTATNPLELPKATPSQRRDQQANPDVKPMADDDTVSDLEWMKRRTGKVVLDDPDAGASNNAPDFIQSDDEDSGPNEGEPVVVDQAPPPIDPAVESIAETSRLFVRNLAYSCSTSDLEEAFKSFGDLSQVSLIFIFCRDI
jgi:multiple RNA-binding domain-containing protein 1